MLYTLGIGTSVAILTLVITVIRDNFPNLKYLPLAAVTCVLGFVGGLVYITPVSK
jgi:solute carrier family 6 amino acid transporter-like protein 5/7/9/14